MSVVSVILSLLLTLLAVIVGMAKVQRLPASAQVRDQAEISPALWLLSGWVELIAAAGLVLGVFASLELALVATVVLLLSFLSLALRQVKARLGIAAVVPALVLTALSAVVLASIAVAG